MRDVKRSACLSLARKQYRISSAVAFPGWYLALKSFGVSVLCTSCSAEQVGASHFLLLHLLLLQLCFTLLEKVLRGISVILFLG